MKEFIQIDNKVLPFNKVLQISGDKSLSIRWALMASQAIGISRGFNLLNSEDVNSTLNGLKKLGIKIVKKKNFTKIFGVGNSGYKIKKDINIDAGNSGTFARLILGILVNIEKKITISGDKSLSNRDFSRITKPLKEIGIKKLSKGERLPLKIIGNKFLRPINYFEKLGSAQCKSSILFAATKVTGITKIKAKKSRNHTELLFKYLKIPLKIRSNKNYDFLTLKGPVSFKAFDYKIPADISSGAFFIALTILSQKSKIILENININETRIGIIKILKMMKANIKIKNIKKYKGEKIANIHVKSSKVLKPIICPEVLNSSCIDEFLIIFLLAARAKGVSSFKNLAELDQKESPRLKIAIKFLNKIGVKTISYQNNLKIYGNPNLDLKNKSFELKDFSKDHRVFMMACIAALTLGGKWKIFDPDSINSSFPNFINLLRKCGAVLKL